MSATLESVTAPLQLDRNAIEQLIPHRGDALLVHSAEVLGEGRFAGSACWSTELAAMQGHFPGRPIVPAVHLVEAAAQIAGAALRASEPQAQAAGGGQLGVLAMIQRCKFLRAVLPGQQVRFTLAVDRATAGFVSVSGQAAVDGQRVAELSFVLGLAGPAELGLS
ncbi:3-hydroxyacyl-ACP dehydratase [Ideonella azotifigens]|uniref:3-hydroxyacyl-ACP dehydratase FabZ n=1 Tax=Ideonella azotifigens TaxID=513160 RepID=A0ABP3UVK6_9BURK|nr:3-hydroxyacyl-ACP dehydratase [Ideonella azotifigens]MCD2339934.1 3-hydroxyacyl-ACP dehydratase [Ideonella azotifigens]